VSLHLAVWCDMPGCGARFAMPDDARSPSLLRAAARRTGWRQHREPDGRLGDFCPRCAVPGTPNRYADRARVGEPA
jgi:hypothetical protein